MTARPAWLRHPPGHGVTCRAEVTKITPDRNSCAQPRKTAHCFEQFFAVQLANCRCAGTHLEIETNLVKLVPRSCF